MNSKSKTTRIGEDFNREIEKIKKARIDLGLDKKKKSTRTLTNLLIKHDSWAKIKQDTIEINLKEKDGK